MFKAYRSTGHSKATFNKDDGLVYSRSRQILIYEALLRQYQQVVKRTANRPGLGNVCKYHSYFAPLHSPMCTSLHCHEPHKSPFAWAVSSRIYASFSGGLALILSPPIVPMGLILSKNTSDKGRVGIMHQLTLL